MKLKISAFFILFIIITVIPLRAELVFLNDGSILEGEIINDIGESITVKDNDNDFHEIQRNNILKIRPSIKIGKVYIQKRSGEGIAAHIIDEDKATYLLRKDLDNADEMIVRKTDVLFISDSMPFDAKGFLESTQIYITWTKPQKPVRNYKIYYSTGKNEKYTLDGTTPENSYTLKNISGDKTYYIIVTSIGIDNLESPPSNELTITASTSRPPLPPKNLAKRLTSDDKIILTWEAEASSLSRIKEYKIFIYDLKNNMREDGKTANTAYTIKGNPKKIKQISVRAVDFSGLESKEAVLMNRSEDFNAEFFVRPLLLFPLGDLRDPFDHGDGATMGFLFHKFNSNSLILSVEAGYLRWSRHDEEFDASLYMIPAVFSIGYRFYFTEKFSLSALAGGGVMLMSRDCYMMIMGWEQDRPFEALFKGSMEFDHMASENISLSIGGGFNSIYRKDKIDEKHKFKNFIDVHIGFSYRLK